MPEIDTLMLANHVESVNGLLYMSGGGWTDLWRASPENPSHFGVAIVALLSEAETAERQPHKISFSIRRESDGKDVVLGVGTFQIGAPPGPDAMKQRHAAVAFDINLVFPGEGDYVLSAETGENREPKKLRFRVHDAAPPGAELLMPEIDS